ncbi:Uncharacterised protein [Candidatus Burarchaeum australiense]|nr:Uncharacterised protein [Candidatus Burarchaeum australiense]
MLPLLLRERLGISKGGPNEKVVGLKIVSVADGKAMVRLSGSGQDASEKLMLSGGAEGANCVPFSKNGKEVR